MLDQRSGQEVRGTLLPQQRYELAEQVLLHFQSRQVSRSVRYVSLQLAGNVGVFDEGGFPAKPADTPTSRPIQALHYPLPHMHHTGSVRHRCGCPYLSLWLRWRVNLSRPVAEPAWLQNRA